MTKYKVFLEFEYMPVREDEITEEDFEKVADFWAKHFRINLGSFDIPQERIVITLEEYE